MRFTLFLLLFLSSCTSVSTKKAMQLQLHAIEGGLTQLDLQMRDSGLVVIMLDAECPICQKYTLTLRELEARYPKTAFVGVFTKWNDDEAITSFARQYELKLPLLQDSRHRLVRALKATTTPEVFLFDPRGTLQYRGAIDNWFYGLGNYRPHITEYYLEDALKALYEGKAAPVKVTRPIGCIIQQ
ncbi:MAG: redoxin domain-containing protein [Saprospiraceae bacterium]|nr:redoxin domain-containing protein [Saprospiraceae bacterium]